MVVFANTVQFSGSLMKRMTDFRARKSSQQCILSIYRIFLNTNLARSFADPFAPAASHPLHVPLMRGPALRAPACPCCVRSAPVEFRLRHSTAPAALCHSNSLPCAPTSYAALADALSDAASRANAIPPAARCRPQVRNGPTNLHMPSRSEMVCLRAHARAGTCA